MKWNQDYFDMFAALNAANVRYLIVGAYAVGFHVEPRTTKDIDIWVEASFENAQRLYKALAEFGAPEDCGKAARCGRRESIGSRHKDQTPPIKPAEGVYANSFNAAASSGIIIS